MAFVDQFVHPPRSANQQIDVLAEEFALRRDGCLAEHHADMQNRPAGHGFEVARHLLGKFASRAEHQGPQSIWLGATAQFGATGTVFKQARQNTKPEGQRLPAAGRCQGDQIAFGAHGGQRRRLNWRGAGEPGAGERGEHGGGEIGVGELHRRSVAGLWYNAAMAAEFCPVMVVLAVSTGVLVAVGAVAVLVLGLLTIVGIYNRLATARVRVANAFSQIDVQLKRRFDLIPNLVEAVKGYMNHERQTLEAVVAARSKASAGLAALAESGQPSGAQLAALAGAVTQFELLLRQLMIRVEAYPDLKASTNFLALQEELVSTENRIAFARQSFNDAVMRYNTLRAVFPQNLIAEAGHFEEATPFSALAEERANPDVAF